MPLVAAEPGQNVPDPYENKHINTIYIDYYQSLGILVDDDPIPFRQLGEEEFFDPALQDGVYAYTPMKGWDPRTTLDITQDEPYSMTIRGIGYSIDFDI